jgi:hypothetical protein
MRKLLTLLGCLSLSGTLLVVVGTGTAWAAVPATGTAACKFVAGSGVFSPPLTPTGASAVKVVKIHFTVTTYSSCGSGVTSPAGETITGVSSVVGTGSYILTTGFANSCANFAASDVVNSIRVKVGWIATPTALTPTIVKYVGNVGTVSSVGGLDAITLTSPATKTGSFASTPATGTTSLQTDAPTACSAAVPSFNLRGNYVVM